MRKLLILAVILLCASVLAESFNEYGVWHAVDTVELSASEKRSFGPINMSGREAEINAHVYAIPTTGDSVRVNLVLYGMMNYALADTAHMRLLTSTGTTSQVSTVITLSDTLAGIESFPYLYGVIENKDADSEVDIDVWLYAKPDMRSLIRLR